MSDDYEAFKVLEGMEALGQALGNVVLAQPTQAQIVMEEDVYCMAANMGLEQAKNRLFSLDEDDAEADFSETRQKVQDVLRSVAVAVANGHQDNNLILVRRVAGLLAKVNWEIPIDEVRVIRLHGDASEASIHLQLQACEDLRPLGACRSLARFMCWEVRSAQEDQKPREVDFMHVVCDGLIYYLQFGFPVTLQEAKTLSGIQKCSDAKPMKVRRWRLSMQRLSPVIRRFGQPSQDLNDDLFKKEYRIYANERWLLVPLMERGSAFRRHWCLLERSKVTGWTSEPLFEAKPYLPPSKAGICEAGPDSRLSEALASLVKAPEQLFANPLVHAQKSSGGNALKTPLRPGQCVRDIPLVEAGLPFLVGNPAAPRRCDKKAAASILRMAILGAPYGVRSFMDQPIGGEEISAACLGAARPSSVSVLENQTRRVRIGSSQKEVTALWNKRATLKANTARLDRRGKVVGSALFDGRCRSFVNGRPCMGLISAKTQRCGCCKKMYVIDVGGEEHYGLLRKKRLLEDPGSLLVSKKMRQCHFPSETHALLWGSDCWSIGDVLSGKLEAHLATSPDVAETVLPPGYSLGLQREEALLYPKHFTIYFLDDGGSLRQVRNRRDRMTLAPEAKRPSVRWDLPRGSFVLVKRDRIVPNRTKAVQEVVQSTALAEEEDLLTQGRQRLRKLLRESVLPSEKSTEVEDNKNAGNARHQETKLSGGSDEDSGEEEYLEISLVSSLDKAVRQQVVSFEKLQAKCEPKCEVFKDQTKKVPTEALEKNLRKQVTLFEKLEKKRVSEEVPEALAPRGALFYDPLDYGSRQWDYPLTDLDFAVEYLEGLDFRGAPYRVIYGGALSRSCRLCKGPSTLGVLKQASEAERCIKASKTFQGSLSTLCRACIVQLATLADARSRELVSRLLEGFSEAEKAVAVILRLRSPQNRTGESHGPPGYRVVHWLSLHGIRNKVRTLDGVPYFVLENIYDYQRLLHALEVESQGEAVAPSPSVCYPHYEDPLDEALSTQNGERTYMQTLEAQSFSRLYGLQKDLLTMLRERRVMYITDGNEEALVGSRSFDDESS